MHSQTENTKALLVCPLGKLQQAREGGGVQDVGGQRRASAACQRLCLHTRCSLA